MAKTVAKIVQCEPVFSLNVVAKWTVEIKCYLMFVCMFMWDHLSSETSKAFEFMNIHNYCNIKVAECTHMLLLSLHTQLSGAEIFLAALYASPLQLLS